MSRDDRRVTIALYALAVCLFCGGQYIYVPTLPPYVQSKTANLALVGFVLSMYGFWQAAVRVPLGIAADWVGWYKPFVSVGLMLSGIGALTLGTATGVEGLAAGRAMTGISAGAWVLLVVTFSALFPPHEAVRASALLTLFNSLGRILATSVTGFLNDWGGYSLAFFVATGLGLFSAVIVLPIHEPRRASQRGSVASIGRLMLRRDVLLPSLLSALSQYVNWGVAYGFLPVLAKQFGATNIGLSMLTTLQIGMFTLGNVFATWSARRIRAERLVFLGLVGLSVGVAGAAVVSSLPLLFAMQACIGLAMGVTYPVLMGMSIQNVTGTERATAMGWHQAIYAIGMFAGPAFSGGIADALGIQPMFAATAGACLVLGLIGTRALVKDEG